MRTNSTINSRTLCDYLFIAHRIIEDGNVKPGGMDLIMNYVMDKGATVGLLENPLFGSGHMILSFGKKRKWQELARINIPFRGPLRWICEIVVVPKLIAANLFGNFVIICADPLNFSSTWPLRKPGRTIIFQVMDYSLRRFPNPILNSIYQFFFHRAIRLADRVWAFSQPLTEICRNRSSNPTKVLWNPNSPFFNNVPRIPARNRNPKDLILVAHFSSSINLEMIAQALKLAPEANLTLIGPGHPDHNIFRKVGVSNRVSILGPLKRSQVLQKIAESGIGLAFYGGNKELDQFRDSLKIREYAAAGLPTICDEFTATAREGNSLGSCFIATTPEKIGEIANNFIHNPELYLSTSTKALKWAMAMDKEKILERLFTDLEFSHFN